MTGPANFGRQPLDELIAAAPNWDGLLQAFAPAKVAEPFDPGDQIKMSLSVMAQNPDGRAVLLWLLDITKHAPYPHVGQTKDAVVIAAAKHEARAAVGEVILRAIADGDAIFRKKWDQRSQPHADTA